MSLLGDILGKAGISQEQMTELVSLLKDDPSALLTRIQEFALPPEILQQLMGVVLMQPQAIEELATELGITNEDLAGIKSSLGGFEF
ncbi:MAG: DUF2999 family protein [bacterium]|nr:DUF2999 family protein [bacterium]